MMTLQAIDAELCRCEEEHGRLCMRTGNLGSEVQQRVQLAEEEITTRLTDLVFMENGNNTVLKGLNFSSIGASAGDNPAVVVASLKRHIIKWKVLRDWYVNLDPQLSIDSYDPGSGSGGLIVQSFDIIASGAVLFLKIKAFIRAPDAKRPGDTMLIPGVIFFRSPAVAILPVFSVVGDDDKYTLITVQPRAPVGISRFQEIPAGMMDENNNFTGVAIKEFKEEIGIDIPAAELICLTDFAFRGLHAGMYPSAGGCNEYLRLFLWRKYFSVEEFNSLKAKVTRAVNGVEKEGEQIRVRVIKLEDLYWEAPDAKALSALALYNKYI